MAKAKRIVSTSYWTDPKIMNDFTAEDKYFMLYLLTGPQTTQLGIYALHPKIIGFDMGYSTETSIELIKRFEERHKVINYNWDTFEISVLNALKHNIVKGGKPVEDLLTKEIAAIKADDLILNTYNHLLKFWELSIRPFDNTVKAIFENEIKKRNVLLLNDNDNDNDNDNEESYHESYNESLSQKRVNNFTQIINKWNSLNLQELKAINPNTNRHSLLSARLKEYSLDDVIKAMDNINNSDFLKGQNDRGWIITFDWLIKPNNFIKVLEGNYNNKSNIAINNHVSISKPKKGYYRVESNQKTTNKTNNDDLKDEQKAIQDLIAKRLGG